MRDRKMIGVLVVAGAVLAFLAFGDLTPGDPVPAVDCPFAIENVNARVTCFQIPVGSGAVLATVLHRRSTPLTDAPVLILPTDAGSTPSFDLDRYAGMKLLDHRDLVLVDPLGSTRTAPAIDCAHLDDVATIESVVRCRDRMIDAGLVDDWSTEQQVAHLEIVRETLAEGRPWSDWHVVGRGNGAQVALRLAAQDARGTASMVLAAATPLDVPPFATRAQAYPSSIAALQLLCSADGGCSGLDPLDETTERVAQRLGTVAEPIEILREDERTRTPIELDGREFRRTVSYALETNSLPEILPWTVARVDDAASEFGLTSSARDTLAGLVSAAADPPTVDPVLWWHITCSEQFDLITHDTFMPLYENTPGLVAPADPAAMCADWPRTDSSTAPVNVDRPILLFDSPFDPMGAPNWTERVATENEGARTIGVTVVEWMPGSSECTADAIARFFENPEQPPDSECIDAPLNMAAHPVPVGGVRQIGGLGETGAMAMGTFAIILVLATTAWIWLGAPAGLSRTLWIITAITATVAFLGTGSMLVVGSQPARLIVQPGWSWPLFVSPWIAMLLTAFGAAATVRDVRSNRLGGRWPARYALLAAALTITLAAMVILGIVPGT